MSVHVTVVVNFPVEFLNELPVDGAFSSGVVVKSNAESLEQFLDELMVPVCELTRGDFLFESLHFNRCSVLVATADEDYVLAFEA